MNLPLLFARRYLLAKRSTNAINIITLISIVVVAVVTAAMVVVLSTLNGITELVDRLYSPFDLDVTITPVSGKTFDRAELPLDRVLAMPGVSEASWTIEENVLLRSGDEQVVATMKGVEPQYLRMSAMDSNMYGGNPVLSGTNGPVVILGAALKDMLRVPFDDGVLRPLRISAPVRGRKLLRYKEQAFEEEQVAVGGAFTINLEFDERYVIAPLALADSLLHYGGAVNALEVRGRPGVDIQDLAGHVRQVVGDGFITRSRYEKNALMYRTNATEKWFTFAVLAFIGLIGAFNIIASLTLMMIEKEQEMRVFIGMGAPSTTVRRVFLFVGLLIVGIGTLGGTLFGLGVCAVQSATGVIGLDNSVVDSYPVKVIGADILLIVSSVLTIGLFATWVSLRGLGQRYLGGQRT